MAIKNALATIYIWIRFEQAITFVVIAAIHILDKVVCKLLLQQNGSKTIAFVSSLSIPSMYLFYLYALYPHFIFIATYASSLQWQ